MSLCKLVNAAATALVVGRFTEVDDSGTEVSTPLYAAAAIPFTEPLNFLSEPIANVICPSFEGAVSIRISPYFPPNVFTVFSPFSSFVTRLATPATVLVVA